MLIAAIDTYAGCHALMPPPPAIDMLPPAPLPYAEDAIDHAAAMPFSPPFTLLATFMLPFFYAMSPRYAQRADIADAAIYFSPPHCCQLIPAITAAFRLPKNVVGMAVTSTSEEFRCCLLDASFDAPCRY